MVEEAAHNHWGVLRPELTLWRSEKKTRLGRFDLKSLQDEQTEKVTAFYSLALKVI